VRYHRSDGDFGICRVADGDGAHGVCDGALGGVELLARHKQPRPSGTGLAAVHKCHAERRWDRLLQIGIIEHDRRRLAAQFERDALQRLGAIAHNAFAHGNRASERYLVYIRIAHELGANDITETGDDVEETIWQPGLMESLDQHPGLQRA
jgi:hypothetical protein